ncbi:hypothetical protein FE633_43915 [Streptomyces montanus]|uniref:Uncharacterized protein n=1 Tax=Streptomyces montanus TaxID=2580423 RepID=A0A5R9FCV7_9ACTN|nr:hypothetical protein [Streptomyces montanus]TLS40006.1 hypothetical protein FE633_43915 [Streptomyces montanus]
MLRSVLVAAFSAVVAFGALSGPSDAKTVVRADSKWPVVAEDTVTAGDSAQSGGVSDEAGS